MQLPRFTALQSMDILIRIESAIAGQGNMITFCLRKAIYDKQPANLIITTVKDMIRDNNGAMEFILGQSLVQRIKTFEP